jgi:hypothetical protein
MPVNYFGSRFRKRTFGKGNSTTYRRCGARPTNFIDQKCVGCVCASKSCSPLVSSRQILEAETRRMYGVSRIPASEFSMNLAAFNVYTGSRDSTGRTWNQSSDRAIRHSQPHPVPSHGSSTRGSVTRLRPGALKPGGTGVDIKHNSYARYLNRIKGGAMLAGPYVGGNVNNKSVVNNKVQKLNSVNCSC